MWVNFGVNADFRHCPISVVVPFQIHMRRILGRGRIPRANEIETESSGFEHDTLRGNALHQIFPGFDERCGAFVQKLNGQGTRAAVSLHPRPPTPDIQWKYSDFTRRFRSNDFTPVGH